jgi:hypothetical protein
MRSGYAGQKPGGRLESLPHMVGLESKCPCARFAVGRNCGAAGLLRLRFVLDSVFRQRV